MQSLRANCAPARGMVNRAFIPAATRVDNAAMTLLLLLRGAVALVLLQLAALVWRTSAPRQTRALGALCCLAVVAFALTSAPGATQWLGPALVPLVLLCVIKAPLFWLFGRSILVDGFRLGPPHLALCAIAMVWGGWQQLVFHVGGRAASADPFETAAALGFEGLVLGFVCLLLFEAWQGLAGDLVERRRRLRILFVAGGGGYLALAVVVQSFNLLLETRTPAALVAANLVAMLALGLLAAWTLVQSRSGTWLQLDAGESARARLDGPDSKVLAALKQALTADKVYREDGLTIGRLAARLQVREHVLRRVINRGLGYPNFNAFLHAFRIDEACERLARADQEQVSVLTIALDVGYGSIGPFNRAFKQRTGMTPSAFRRARSQPSQPGEPARAAAT
jgi:AraC-like DNA-binding protein